MHSRIFAGLCACPFLVISAATPAIAHGIAGSRFFPATLVVEDPFAADEAALPTLSTHKEPSEGDEPRTRETETEVEGAKVIAPHLAVSLGESYVTRNADGPGGTASGFGNLELGAKYQFLTSAAHEAVAALNLEFSIGGTGARQVEAEAFTRFEPSLLFGKGFGDLPESLRFLRPIALTGGVGLSVPFDRDSTVYEGDPPVGDTVRNHNSLTYGLTLQYSLAYLQSSVKDIGLGDFARRLVPIVEIAGETPFDGGGGERTTATVNPGVLWTGNKIQLGIEAICPINAASGADVGVIAQLHLYLDDIL